MDELKNQIDEMIANLYDQANKIQEDCIVNLLKLGCKLEDIELVARKSEKFILDKASGVGYIISSVWENNKFYITATPGVYSEWIARLKKGNEIGSLGGTTFLS